MALPQIPDGSNRPNFDDLMIDLLETVALDHMSLSNIMNAQGELMQEMTNKWCCDQINYQELANSCEATNKMLNDIIMKEWLMQQRLNNIMELQKNRLQQQVNEPKKE